MVRRSGSRSGRNIRNVRSRMAARNTGHRTRNTGMSRRRFIGGVAAGVAGAALAGAGVAHATPTEHNVYPTGNPANDPGAVQTAINNANPGDTILLHSHTYPNPGPEVPMAFDFGTDGSIEITQDVNIIGEVITRHPASPDFITPIPGGIGVLVGTTIIGGKDTIFCNSKVNLTVRDIRFQDGWDTAIIVRKTSGLTVSGCSIVGREQTVPGLDIPYTTVAHGIWLGEAYEDFQYVEPNEFSGNLLIEKNYVSIGFGETEANDTAAISARNISAVMTIKDNELRDGDFNMVSLLALQDYRDDNGDPKHVFENNVIDTGPTNFGFNALVWGKFPPWHPYAAVGDPNAGMIVKGNTIIQRGKGDTADTVWIQVSKGSIIRDNTVVCREDGGAVFYGAISGMIFENTLVHDNIITGKVNDSTFGVFYLSSGNSFINNDCSGITAANAQVYVDGYSHKNYFGPDPALPYNPNTNPGNEFGPVLDTGLAAVFCAGDGNKFINNDYTQTDVPGWTLSNPYGPGSLLIYRKTKGNDVLEKQSLLGGTQVICEQIYSIGIGNDVIEVELTPEPGMPPEIFNFNQECEDYAEIRESILEAEGQIKHRILLPK